jgi:hypothetical protein
LIAGAFGELLGKKIVTDADSATAKAGLRGFAVSFLSLAGFCLFLAFYNPNPWDNNHLSGFLFLFIGACVYIGWIIFPIGALTGIILQDSFSSLPGR